MSRAASRRPSPTGRDLVTGRCGDGDGDGSGNDDCGDDDEDDAVVAAVISAGATRTVASKVSRRIPSKRAITDAFSATPSESRLVLPGIERTASVVGGVGGTRGWSLLPRVTSELTTRAELVEPLRDPLRHLDDFRIAFTSRLGAHDVAGSEHHHR